MLILLIVSLGLFIVGRGMDYRSSLGQPEGTALYQDATMHFDGRKYVIYSALCAAIILAVSLVAGFIVGHVTYLVGIMAYIGFAIKGYLDAKRNDKITGRQ
jgi:hypothetical protein